jgi:4-hydroxy-tetrahydrodipicolinate reductase
MSKLNLAIHGAAGRMGQRLIALGSLDHDVKLAAALEYAGNPQLGEDAGEVAGVGKIGLPLTSGPEAKIDALIDFSTPEGAAAAIAMCAYQKIPLVMATTGLSEESKNNLHLAANSIPIVWSPSMSTAVNLTMKLCATAGAVLKNVQNGCDVEIIERHHRFKEDAPSGTALKFGEIIAGVMGQTDHLHGREGKTGKRTRQEIAYHALRCGDNPGEHTIVFGMLGETIELTVKASNRDCYALGAIEAAKFVAGKPPGIYSMYDVLGL